MHNLGDYRSFHETIGRSAGLSDTQKDTEIRDEEKWWNQKVLKNHFTGKTKFEENNSKEGKERLRRQDNNCKQLVCPWKDINDSNFFVKKMTKSAIPFQVFKNLTKEKIICLSHNPTTDLTANKLNIFCWKKTKFGNNSGQIWLKVL